MAKKGVSVLHIDPSAEENSNSDSEDVKCSSVGSSSSSLYVKGMCRRANKCHVCSVEFTFSNRRHHCRKCYESVCGLHSARRQELFEDEAPVRVCDKCIRESIKIKTRVETGDPVFHKQQLLDRLKDECRSQMENTAAKEREIVLIQEKCNKKVRSDDFRLTDLEDNIQRETEQYDRKQRIIQELRAGYQSSKEVETRTKQRLSSTEAQLRSLRDEVSMLSRENALTLETIEIRTDEFKGRIYSSEVRRLLCDECRVRIGTIERPRERIRSLETIGEVQQTKTCAQKCEVF